MSIENRLRKVVLGILAEPGIDFGDSLSPANCAAWDSVAMIQIMLALEEEFEVRFTTDEIASVENVGALRTLLANHGKTDGEKVN